MLGAAGWDLGQPEPPGQVALSHTDVAVVYVEDVRAGQPPARGCHILVSFDSCLGAGLAKNASFRTTAPVSVE